MRAFGHAEDSFTFMEHSNTIIENCQYTWATLSCSFQDAAAAPYFDKTSGTGASYPTRWLQKVPNLRRFQVDSPGYGPAAAAAPSSA